MFRDQTGRFQEALQRQIEQPQVTLDLFSRALADWAGAARESGMTAEQLLILAKQEWEQLERAGSVPSSPVHDRLRQKVITSVIKAYYMQ